MAKPLSKPDFLTGLRTHIRQHNEVILTQFQPLEEAQLNRRPDAKNWSILQCFEHLNLTHEYYRPKIDAALGDPRPANPGDDTYKPSFWGRIYMYFSFNPRYSFPTADAITPGTTLSEDVLNIYLSKQEELLHTLDLVGDVDLRNTLVPLERGIEFNLGDCLKVLVYHDELHIGQAQGVLDSTRHNQP